MKGSLVVIRGGLGDPRAMLTVEDNITEAQKQVIVEKFNEWWTGGYGVAFIANVTLSVVEIDLDKGGISIVSPK